MKTNLDNIGATIAKTEKPLDKEIKRWKRKGYDVVVPTAIPKPEITTYTPGNRKPIVIICKVCNQQRDMPNGKCEGCGTWYFPF